MSAGKARRRSARMGQSGGAASAAEEGDEVQQQYVDVQGQEDEVELSARVARWENSHKQNELATEYL